MPFIKALKKVLDDPSEKYTMSDLYDPKRHLNLGLGKLKEMVLYACAKAWNMVDPQHILRGCATFLDEVKLFVGSLAPEFIDKAVKSSTRALAEYVHRYFPLEGLAQVVQQRSLELALRMQPNEDFPGEVVTHENQMSIVGLCAAGERPFALGWPLHR